MALVERPDWGEGGESRARLPAAPSSDGSGIARPDWGPDDSDAALVDAGVFTQEQITALQTGNPVPADSESGLDVTLIAEWENTGGVEYHLEVAETAAQSVLDSMPDADGFQSSFDALPQGVQTAVFRELALTPRHRGTQQDALARLDRIFASVSSSDFEAAAEWEDSLTPTQYAAMLRALAGH